MYEYNREGDLCWDIDGLLKGKKSVKNTDQSIKILGLYHAPAVREATEHFVRHLRSDLKEKVIIYEAQQDQPLDNRHVYVVFVE